MRTLIVTIAMLAAAVSAHAQVSIGINAGGVNIGINMQTYPDLVQVPGYPVYYDPQAEANYFFYDGLYWVYDGDTWYDSTWYNGPWQSVNDQYVPLYVLRVPVRYYRRPPTYFDGWSADAPPRWGEHWGHSWESRHAGWDRWNRNSVPAPAPLPLYQRQYTGDRYPREVRQQHTIQSQNYHYQPRETVSRQHFQAQPVAAKEPAARGSKPSARVNPSPPQPPPEQAHAPVRKPAPVQHAAPVAPAGSERKGNERTDRARINTNRGAPGEQANPARVRTPAPNATQHAQPHPSAAPVQHTAPNLQEKAPVVHQGAQGNGQQNKSEPHGRAEDKGRRDNGSKDQKNEQHG